MKWRKVKKKIKKDIIPGLIGRMMCTDDIWIEITKVKISPGGGKNVKYSIIGIPPENPPVQPVVDENSIGNASASWNAKGPFTKSEWKAIKQIFGI